MSTTLVPMDPRCLPDWIGRMCAGYAEDLVAAGRDPDEARRHADESMARAFPSGAPAPGHAVFDVVDDAGRTVGNLWIGPDASDDPDAWWVWEVAIDADERGKGFGRAAMLLGEEYARSQGAHTLGLNVFGFNTVARGLYESLGYATTSVRMHKRLA